MEQQLVVRVLGGTRLAVDGRPLVELASAKATALLVYLAVTGRAHARTALAGLLWSDLPEATARANLRLVLTKLRRALPDHVEAGRQTVALAADRPVWVDALEVDRLAAGGGDDQELLAAVRLCRGEFLEGFEVQGAPLFDEWLLTRRAVFRAATLALMDRAIQSARDRGDAATGTEVARLMLELEPLHEEAHRALMWFMAKGDQRGAALAQFETCRYVLREELGVEPSEATLVLRDEIARSGGFTELGEAAVQPAGVEASPLAATVGQATPTTAEAGTVTGTPGAASPPHAPDLPGPLTALVGREQELARLQALLDDSACRLVTLVGPGGIGKTRLAVEVTAARQDRRRDGAVFVSFVGTSPARPEEAADLVVANLAAALGVSLAVPRDPLELLADHLAGRELLLVLDNLEQLRDAAAAMAELLRRSPGVQLLVTSRRRLGLGVEWLVEVPGLPYPPAGGAPSGYEAVELFEARASLVRRGFRLASDPEGVARVCRLVAGVPLAIELAARWVRSASPTAIAERLATGLDLLETTAPDVELRHRSLRSVIDWSWRLLTDDERRVLARLSVLRGGFDLDAAAVAGASLPLLAGLVDQSLVEVGEDGRYGMHELLRQYAADRLATDPDDERATRERHAAYFAGLLPEPEVADVGGGPDLGADVENLRAATDWLVANAEPARLGAYLDRLWPLYRRRGWFREAQAVLGAALERDGVPVIEQARWHRMLGEAHLQIGAAGTSRDHLERSLALLGSPAPASAAGWRAMLSRQALRRALRTLRPGGSVERRPDLRARAAEQGRVAWPLMESYFMLNERAAMLPSSMRGLNQAERSGQLEVVVPNRVGFGMILGAAGYPRLADRHVRAATDALEQVTTDSAAQVFTCVVGGLHWLGAGNWAEFDAGYTKAMRITGRANLHRWTDEMVLLAAITRYMTARYTEAAAMAAEAMATGRERRDPFVQLWGLLVLAEVTLRVDAHDPRTEAWMAEATPLFTRGVTAIDIARAHAATARFHLAAGRPGEAWRSARAADDLIGDLPSFAQYTLEAHAGVPEVCLALLERDGAGVDLAELGPATATAARRLSAYARYNAMARPRAQICVGWSEWLAGRHGRAARAWARAAREAARLRTPYELARAHYELGRHLGPEDRSPLDLHGREHLDRARAGFEAIGCRTDLDAVESLTATSPSR
jgi:predicted ATPase/DNA-binding SARP family transcriptional activator